MGATLLKSKVNIDLSLRQLESFFKSKELKRRLLCRPDDVDDDEDKDMSNKSRVNIVS